MEAYELVDVLRMLDELPHRRELERDVDETDESVSEREQVTLDETPFESMSGDARYRLLRVVERLEELFKARIAGRYFAPQNIQK